MITRFHIRARWREHTPKWAIEALKTHDPARTIHHNLYITGPDEPGNDTLVTRDREVLDRRHYKTREAAVMALMARAKTGSLSFPHVAIVDIVERQ